jgi:hypothetical protein
VFGVTRSADGSTLTGREGEGLGEPPLLIVRTNATAFDQAGAARFTAGDEFLVMDDDGIDQVYLQDDAAFTGLFRPVVPEPATAALAVPALALLARRPRRRMTRT